MSHLRIAYTSATLFLRQYGAPSECPDHSIGRLLSEVRILDKTEPVSEGVNHTRFLDARSNVLDVAILFRSVLNEAFDSRLNLGDTPVGEY